jgi:hypothetical protein
VNFNVPVTVPAEVAVVIFPPTIDTRGVWANVIVFAIQSTVIPKVAHEGTITKALVPDKRHVSIKRLPFKAFVLDKYAV